MLNFLISYSSFFNGIHLFKYITFRTMLALIMAFFLSFFLYPVFIKYFKREQPIRTDGPEAHLVTKKGTPTIGGIIIVFTTIIPTLFFGDLRNYYLWGLIGLTFCYGLIGFLDDYLKIKFQNSKGLEARYKFLLQIVFALIFSYIIELLREPSVAGHLTFPFLKNFTINCSFLLIIFTTFVVVGSSNAVNLTDGLDGLVTFPVILVTVCLGVISYVVGHFIFAKYLHIMYIRYAGEICIYCGALIGACLGFLWYNAPPAMIFMGDTGALAIGGALGGVSIIIKHEFVLAILGGVFVLEALSVMLQVLYFKLTGRRIFLMAPIHHHFEKKGWPETKVVVRFWILSFFFALIGLATLKIR